MLIESSNENNIAFVEIEKHLSVQNFKTAIAQCGLCAILINIVAVNMNITAISMISQNALSACLTCLSLQLDEDRNLKDCSLKVSSDLLNWASLNNAILLMKHLLQETKVQEIVTDIKKKRENTNRRNKRYKNE
eukprot:GHVP01065674.1.p1 GENE.GHVP01065674.1~~GHVP01065674.1.p1  ORF type:complete len:134 (-),score=24.01 GHVP01065674.1:344-745(-)